MLNMQADSIRTVLKIIVSFMNHKCLYTCSCEMFILEL